MQRDKHFTFEDPKAASSDGSATSAAAEEWIDAIESAREMALSQGTSNSYSNDEAFKGLPTDSSQTTNGLGLDNDSSPDLPSRNTLQKQYANADRDSFMGRKRFSKRQSKNGLAAVF